MWLFFKAQGLRMTPNSTQEWRDVVVIGLPNILGWHGLSIIALTQLPAGRAATLGFTMPVWTVLLSVLLYREPLTRRLVVAVVAVLTGIALLLWDELGRLSGSPGGIFWMQGAAACWALGTIWTQRAKLTMPPEAFIVWMMALSAVVMAGLAVALEPPQNWNLRPAVWLSLAWGVLINYGAAQVIWFRLARALPPATSAMSLMAIPLIGIMSAPLIVGEWPRWQDLAAMGCVVVAIGAVLLRRD